MTVRTPSVTVLTEYFYPEEASTALLMTELTTGLAGQFDVSVITGRPNYHDADRQESMPLRECHEGVSIRRVRATRFDKDSLPLRIINWISFTFLSLLNLLRPSHSAEVVMALSNPPILPFAAWCNKRVTKTPYVYLVYDMYPDMAIELGYLSARNPVAKLWAWGVRYVYRDADRVVVLGESMRRRVEKKMADDPQFDSDNVVVIPNWENEEFIQPMDKTDNEFAKTHNTTDNFTLVYSGNIGRFHDLKTAIDAIGLLEDRGQDDVQLLVIGEGACKEALIKRTARRGIENVQFLPFQPLDKLPETLTCGDASLVGIRPELVGMCVSSKLYSSLAAGMPVLAVVGDGDEVARVVKECKCGEHVLPGDAEQAADVIERWMDGPDLTARLGQNARKCFEERYTANHAVSKYGDLFETIIAEC